jgi:hypothetical protein
VSIGFIETDFSQLKAELVVHCQEWQSKLTGLLKTKLHSFRVYFSGLMNRNAQRDLNALIEYFESNSITLLQEPKTFDELR